MNEIFTLGNGNVISVLSTENDEWGDIDAEIGCFNAGGTEVANITLCLQRGPDPRSAMSGLWDGAAFAPDSGHGEQDDFYYAAGVVGGLAERLRVEGWLRDYLRFAPGVDFFEKDD